MATKSVNKLIHNLPHLQNLIKRDPGSYKEEVCAVATILFTIAILSYQNSEFNNKINNNINFIFNQLSLIELNQSYESHRLSHTAVS